MSQRKKLIWFQHLHKCAGSTLVFYAIKNGETLHRPHLNGNPFDGVKGMPVPLWNFSKAELTSFIDGQIDKGVSFIACEYGGPKFEAVFEHKDVTTVTLLRDPYRRFLSAYYFYFLRRGTITGNPESFFRCTEWVWCFEDYYTRIFSEANATSAYMNDDNFKLALENLSRFDHVVSVDKKGWESPLFKKLGWEALDKYENRNANSNIRIAAKCLLKFKFGEFHRRLKYRPVKDSRYLDLFSEYVVFDNELMDAYWQGRDN